MSDPIRIQPNSGVKSAPTTGQPAARPASNSTFAQTLEQVQNVKFSNHAQKRLDARNINLSDDGLQRLNAAVDKADKRGGRESLVLVDDMAFIVNIKDRMVITALDAQSRGEGVFTQIDSVVFADPGSSQSTNPAASLQATGDHSVKA
jgi:flagellar operon protein